MSDSRPRRSALYMPAANERALEKAKALAADSIIFDLEDAVAPDAKEPASVGGVCRGCVGAVRAAGTDHSLQRSRHTMGIGRSRRNRCVDSRCSRRSEGQFRGVPRRRLPTSSTRPAHRRSMTVWAMIETPTAVLDVRGIAAHPRVSVLVMGTNDLARELRAPLAPGRRALLSHLANALLAAREAGKVILDGVYNDMKDLDGFREECAARRGVRLRRQDIDPPQPGRHRQRGVGAFADPTSNRPGGSSPPSTKPWPTGAAW